MSVFAFTSFTHQRDYRAACSHVPLAAKPGSFGSLWLILSFISAAGLFVLLGAEFVAMLLVIVYVGAVAVLFLFVVMMLDVDFAELKAEMARYMPLALLIGLVILMQFVNGLLSAWKAVTQQVIYARKWCRWTGHNTEALGMICMTSTSCCFSLQA
ncbi:UNVERIFIED_CONTAM: hypothetical protein GTU68_001669 [Idotea baltica]|nr:hypothetical protein [Idotea baltica]